MAGSRTKKPVESRSGCIPLSQIPLCPAVATAPRPGVYVGGRIPYKKKNPSNPSRGCRIPHKQNISDTCLPDPVQKISRKIPRKSRGNLNIAGLGPEVKNRLLGRPRNTHVYHARGNSALCAPWVVSFWVGVRQTNFLLASQPPVRPEGESHNKHQAMLRKTREKEKTRVNERNTN